MIVRTTNIYTPVWMLHEPTSKIQIIQNKCLKTINNSPWAIVSNELHEITNYKTIEEIIGNKTEKNYSRCRTQISSTYT